MTREQVIKLLSNPKASREQLRRSLAEWAGVPYEPRTTAKPENEKSLFARCQFVFMQRYKDEAKVKYSFGAKDGRALKEIIEKIRAFPDTETDEQIYITFCALMKNLPQWYIKNSFSLSRINNDFNIIIANIKTDGGQGITNDLKQRTINALLS